MATVKNAVFIGWGKNLVGGILLGTNEQIFGWCGGDPLPHPPIKGKPCQLTLSSVIFLCVFHSVHWGINLPPPRQKHPYTPLFH